MALQKQRKQGILCLRQAFFTGQKGIVGCALRLLGIICLDTMYTASTEIWRLTVHSKRRMAFVGAELGGISTEPSIGPVSQKFLFRYRLNINIEEECVFLEDRMLQRCLLYLTKMVYTIIMQFLCIKMRIFLIEWIT